MTGEGQGQLWVGKTPLSGLLGETEAGQELGQRSMGRGRGWDRATGVARRKRMKRYCQFAKSFTTWR